MLHKIDSNYELGDWLTTLAFCLFLIPIGADGLSLNYSFVLFPIGYIFYYRKAVKPSFWVLLAVCVFTLIYFLGLFTNLFVHINLMFRSLVSFIIFISVFSFSLIPINRDLIKAFKRAIILMALYFSIISIFRFITSGITDIGLLKSLIGSQRSGFIHSMAFFLLLVPGSDLALKKTHKGIVLCIILVGLILTFSRTPIIALVSTYFFYKVSQFRLYHLFSFRWYINVLVGLTSLAIVIGGLYLILPDIFTFFNERLVERLLLNSSSNVYSNPETSEGTRLEIWKTIWDYCLQYPVQGTGYLGAFVLKSKISFGSAHSQYMDVLLRVGFIGVAVYLLILLKVSNFLYSYDKSVFWAFISILIYGLFHETFKESQGAFILCFLIAYSTNLVNTMSVNERLLRINNEID